MWKIHLGWGAFCREIWDKHKEGMQVITDWYDAKSSSRFVQLANQQTTSASSSALGAESKWQEHLNKDWVTVCHIQQSVPLEKLQTYSFNPFHFVWSTQSTWKSIETLCSGWLIPLPTHALAVILSMHHETYHPLLSFLTYWCLGPSSEHADEID